MYIERPTSIKILGKADDSSIARPSKPGMQRPTLAKPGLSRPQAVKPGMQRPQAVKPQSLVEEKKEEVTPETPDEKKD